MTQWELKISLVLFAVINLSQEHCNDYFIKEKVKDWGKELDLQVPLIKMLNLRDTMLCSANETCRQNSDSTSCILADLCGPMPRHCNGENLETIPFYLFMCLMENALPDVDVTENCKYVAEYSLTHIIVFDQTPTTATLSKTTAEPTKCAETPPTPTTAALPTKPPAVLQSSEVTEKSTGVERPPSEAKSVQVMTTGNITLVVVLLLCVVIIVLLAADKLGQMRQNCRKKCTELYPLNEIPSEVESLSPTNIASPQDQIM